MTGVEELDGWAASELALGRCVRGVRQDRRVIERFLDDSEKRGVGSVYQAGKADFLAWLDLLVSAKKRDGARLAPSTLNKRVWAVRSFYRFLLEKGKVLSDPTESFRTLEEERLPRRILSRLDVEQLLAAPNLATPLGYRDLAILELLYSTGLRRGEVANLEVDDVDFQRGLLRVEMAKNKIGRLAAIGRTALGFLSAYLDQVRPALLGARRSTALFVSVQRKALTPAGIGEAVKRYVRLGVVWGGHSTHSLRHTCATHMLEGGAGVRLVAEQLGHASLDSTVVYTRITATSLRKALGRHHPREKAKAAAGEAEPVPLRSFYGRTRRRRRRRKARRDPMD